jgi:hemolysin activation/secretion protein
MSPTTHLRWLAALSSATALGLCTAGWAHAQTPPTYTPPVMDAGALARQVDQSVMDGLSQRQRMATSALPPALSMSDDTRVSVQRFAFHGNKLLPTVRLQQLAAPYLNRPLDSHDLQQLTQAVTEAYRRIGWQAQAYVPRQSLSEDVLILQIIEGQANRQ